jgi:TonB family protein
MRNKILHAGALVLAFGMALPATAADARAIKSRVPPIYPEIAKRMRISGQVKVEVTVSPEGRVTDVKTLSGNHFLTPAAEEAVRKWRFESGPGISTAEVEIDFNSAE